MKIKLNLSLLALAFLFMPGCTKSCGKAAPAPEASVFFEGPKDGEHVKPTFEVKFGVKGKTVRPAMEDVKDKTSGHHHLLIDDPKGYIDQGQVVPTDENHIHYGKGETSATITLASGKHTLSMQFADGAHLSYGKPMSATINIIVDEEEKAPEAASPDNDSDSDGDEREAAK